MCFLRIRERESACGVRESARVAYERECVWRKRKCVCGVRERARGSGGRLEREREREPSFHFD